MSVPVHNDQKIIISNSQELEEGEISDSNINKQDILNLIVYFSSLLTISINLLGSKQEGFAK